MLRAECLRGVFQHGDAVFLPEGNERRHVGAAAVEVDGDDRFDGGIFLQRSLSGVRAEVVGRGINIRKNRRRADAGNAARRGEESVGRGEHRIAGPDAERHEQHELGICATAAPDGVPRASVGDDFTLQGVCLWPEDERLRIADRFDSGKELAFERSVLCAEIEKRDLHRGHDAGKARGASSTERG